MNSELILNSLSVLFLFRIALYAIGDPHALKPNPASILFKYSYLLAYASAIKANQLAGLSDHLSSSCLTIEQRNDLRLQVFNIGKKHFTWQSVVGMCGICTFFWVSFIIILIPNFNIYGIFAFSSINYLNKILLKWI